MAARCKSLKLYSCSISKSFQSFPEIEVFNFHYECVYISAFAAAKTVKGLPFRGDTKGGGFLIMKRAFASESLSALPQDHIVTDNLGNIKSGFDLSDIIAGHGTPPVYRKLEGE